MQQCTVLVQFVLGCEVHALATPRAHEWLVHGVVCKNVRIDAALMNTQLAHYACHRATARVNLRSVFLKTSFEQHNTQAPSPDWQASFLRTDSARSSVRLSTATSALSPAAVMLHWERCVALAEELKCEMR